MGAHPKSLAGTGWTVTALLLVFCVCAIRRLRQSVVATTTASMRNSCCNIAIALIDFGNGTDRNCFLTRPRQLQKDRREKSCDDMNSDVVKLWLKLLLLGSVSFWTPDVIVHSIAGHSFSVVHATILTFLLPVAFGCAYLLAVRQYRDSAVPIFLPMVIGVWALGGLFMTVGTSFCGGGLAYLWSLEAWRDVLLGFLPPFTFIMATYDGSLVALLFASLGVLLASYGLERKAGCRE
jgi:hypothetical protein